MDFCDREMYYTFLGTFLRQIEKDRQDPSIILDVEDKGYEEVSENGSTSGNQSKNDLDESWTGVLGNILVYIVTLSDWHSYTKNLRILASQTTFDEPFSHQWPISIPPFSGGIEVGNWYEKG